MKILNFLFVFLLFWIVGLGDFSWRFDLSSFGLEGATAMIASSKLAEYFDYVIAISALVFAFMALQYKKPAHFYGLFYLLGVSLLLIVYARDYLLFFIGWEIMSIATYFLFSYTLSPQALLKYILFAMASAMSLIAAIAILYANAHSFLYDDAHSGFVAMNQTTQIIFVGLLMFALFIKMGTIGFHYWLVDSYEESSHLFTPFLAAVLSKMGVFGLIIFDIYVVGGGMLSKHWVHYGLAILGVATSIIASFKALQEDSIKRLLAYSSIAQLGYILTALSLVEGMGGALYHLLIHTLVKLLLFVNIAGVISVAARSKFSELGGLVYKMPQSFLLMLLGIIVLAGMPPLAGFGSKFLIYASLLQGKNLLILAAMLFASAASFLYIYKLVYGIFLGHPTSRHLEEVREANWIFLIPQYIIAAILLLLSAFPALIIPYYNALLVELHLEPLPFEGIAILSVDIASYNGFVLFGVFVALFIIVTLLMLSLGSKKVEVKNRFDIAYCGEVPNEATHLHYGFSIGKEMSRITLVRLILTSTSKKFYDALAAQLFGLAEILRNIYSGNLSLNFNIAILFVLLLFWWGIR